MAFNIDNELLYAYCEKHGYDPAEGLTKKQFVLTRLVRQIREDATEHIASKVAKAEMNRFANTVITIT